MWTGAGKGDGGRVFKERRRTSRTEGFGGLIPKAERRPHLVQIQNRFSQREGLWVVRQTNKEHFQLMSH